MKQESCRQAAMKRRAARKKSRSSSCRRKTGNAHLCASKRSSAANPSAFGKQAGYPPGKTGRGFRSERPCSAAEPRGARSGIPRKEGLASAAAKERPEARTIAHRRSESNLKAQRWNRMFPNGNGVNMTRHSAAAAPKTQAVPASMARTIAVCRAKVSSAAYSRARSMQAKCAPRPLCAHAGIVARALSQGSAARRRAL